MSYAGILNYRSYRYLWFSLALGLAASVVYVSQYASDTPRGNTWQGYALGTVAGLGIVWLAYLGVRRRQYGSGGAPVLGWTSAHVYIGLLVLLIATLHSSGRITWTLHGVTYLLALIVTLSGVFGMAVYFVCPSLAARNRSEGSRAQMFAQLLDLDRKSRALARRCTPRISSAVLSAIDHTVVGGGVWAQLSGLDQSRFLLTEDVRGAERSRWVRNRGQGAITRYVAERIPRAPKRAEVEALQELLPVLSRRQAALRRIRIDVQLQGLMSIWLFIHVPFTVALVGALLAHIFSVFIYW
jgi:hypothetical protein